jgi:hypothetical protein
LKGRADESSPEPASKSRQRDAPATRREPERSGQQRNEGGGLASDILFGRRGPRGGRQTQGLVEAMAKSAARSVGSQAGRALIRGLLGSLLGGRR